MARCGIPIWVSVTWHKGEREMIRILKEIIAFSGKKKKLFTKAVIVSFIGAVFMQILSVQEKRQPAGNWRKKDLCLK